MRPLFIVTLLTIVKLWKQQKCLSVDEWMKKLFYTHTHTHTHMKYYSAIKIRHFWPFVTTCMKLEGIVLRVISQRKMNAV